MKVENHTRWQTAHLRAITRRVLKDVLDVEKRKRTLVVFDTARSSHVNGFAYCHLTYRNHKGGWSRSKADFEVR